MAKFRLNRRTVLRGAGTIAIALPWLEIMGTPKRAYGQTIPAKRFMTVFQPGGTVMANWRPTGTEAAPVLSPILAPLEPMKSKLLIIDGVDMKSAVGEQHQAGSIAWLTGSIQNGAAGVGYSTGPSIDQVLATRLSAGKKKSSIQVAVRWATGKSYGLLSPINATNFENAAPYRPIPPRLDPQAIWTDLFGSLVTTAPGAAVTSDADIRRKSILDFVDKKYVTLSAKLGVADKAKLDEHLTRIRELEQSINVTTTVTGVCKQPVKVATADYNPASGLMSAPDGSLKDPTTDAAIPKVGQFMMDMLVMALACDMTGVVSLQWSDTEAKHTFPWLGLSEHHHYYQHDGGFRPVECAQIDTWYSTMHLYLLQKMAAVDMGGHTLLDESVVFFGSELSTPNLHLKANMPFMLAGGGGMRTGRWVKYPNPSHNGLLVSILNLFGDNRTSFGSSPYNTPALTNIV
jgi:Protein of unknown function (DUF1552)